MVVKTQKAVSARKKLPTKTGASKKLERRKLEDSKDSTVNERKANAGLTPNKSPKKELSVPQVASGAPDSKRKALLKRMLHSVCVKQVKAGTVDKDVTDFFASAGNVVKIKFVRSKAMAVVLFDSEQAVVKALTLHKNKLKGQVVAIERAVVSAASLEKRKLKDKKRRERKQNAIENPHVKKISSVVNPQDNKKLMEPAVVPKQESSKKFTPEEKQMLRKKFSKAKEMRSTKPKSGKERSKTMKG